MTTKPPNPVRPLTSPFPLTTPPELVIFDCDGVLVDSEPLGNAVMAEDLLGRGFQITGKECEARFVGGAIKDVAARIRADGVDLPEDWPDQYYAKLYARLEQGVDPIAGIHELLDRLDAANLAYCVASNGSDEKMHITLGQTGLKERLAGRLFSAHSVGIAKPDPGLFQHAASTLGARFSACVVVEDSATGAKAARAADMACIGLAEHGDGANLAGQNAHVVKTLADIGPLLGLKP